MHTDTIHAHAVPAPRGDRRWAARLFHGVLNRFLLLPLGAIVAIVWANTDAETYFRFSHALAFPVNEIGMAFFLALIAQELYEALMPGGVLRSWRHWAAAVIGAVGGLIGSVVAFLMFVGLRHELVLASAWPVAAAVDMAAGYYVLRLIYPRRAGVVVFLLLMAAVIDVIAMAVVSVQAPGFELHPAGFGLLVLALLGAVALRRRNVRTFWPYWLGCGPVSWLALYWMGIHPALALIPIVPLLPHDARKTEVFADRLDRDPVHHAEHEWNVVAQIALFLFGLVNAGVILKQVDTGTWAVLLAALVGRPVGILAAIALAVNAGLHLPRRMHWPDLAVAALATTSGFTFALFLGSAALPLGAVQQQIMVGALATASGAALTVGLARLLSVGRFAPAHPNGKASLSDDAEYFRSR